MADNYLENQYEQYQARKAAWEKANKFGKKKTTTANQAKPENPFAASETDAKNKFVYRKLDAFTSGQSKGNPAACLFLDKDQQLTEEEMLSIAKDHKGFVSEVVYCSPLTDNGYRLRYYSSECEVEFCGHGTIACMYNLVKSNKELQQVKEVTIKTNKGDLELVLYKKAAPGTVVSFVKLVKSGFYNNKFFHRVVPNFVIQTGCPRGDGYGSPDFTIRTENCGFQYNDEGWLGMASAGRDTESSQWFITLNPTPHLDGNYTLFGKVTKGMDVVQNIEIGDKISSVKLNN